MTRVEYLKIMLHCGEHGPNMGGTAKRNKYEGSHITMMS